MKKRLSPYFETIVSVVLIAVFAALVFGQERAVVRESETEIFVRVLGWIVLSGAGLTHIVTNVWSVWRGKNYEQLKEAVSNFRTLYESGKAQLAEANAEIAKLEQENDNLKERILRIP